MGPERRPVITVSGINTSRSRSNTPVQGAGEGAGGGGGGEGYFRSKMGMSSRF